MSTSIGWKMGCDRPLSLQTVPEHSELQATAGIGKENDMVRQVMIRATLLFFGCVLFACSLASTATYAQVAEAPKAEEAKVVEDIAVPAVDIQVFEAALVVGEAVAEEGMEVAAEAVQLAMGLEGDPQASKLLSKVAVDNALIRRICKLNDEQLQQLKSLDAKWVKGKAAAGKQAGNFAAGVLRVFAGGNVGVQPANPAEASSRVTAAYKTKLKEILNPEQLAEYEKHVKDRDAFRRQANAECIVAVLEERLSLNDSQRQDLVKSLSEWSGIQRMQATFYFQNQAYIPNLPASVLKALTATQRKILDGMQKADFQFESFNDGQEAVFIAQ
jgi:hypothetical protein